MSKSDTMVETPVVFDGERLIVNAKLYGEHAQLINAASRYDSLDDAKAAMTKVWEVLEAQIADGSGYTPDSALGFGSDNASAIAESLLGRRHGIGAIRKAFKAVGK